VGGGHLAQGAAEAPEEQAPVAGEAAEAARHAAAAALQAQLLAHGDALRRRNRQADGHQAVVHAQEDDDERVVDGHPLAGCARGAPLTQRCSGGRAGARSRQVRTRSTARTRRCAPSTSCT